MQRSSSRPIEDVSNYGNVRHQDTRQAFVPLRPAKVSARNKAIYLAVRLIQHGGILRKASSVTISAAGSFRLALAHEPLLCE